MRFNADFAADKLALAAQALGVNTAGLDDRAAALAAADAVETLMKNSKHPLRLRDVGLKEEDLGICAFHAMGDAASLFNARPVGDPQEVLNLYLEAY